MSSVVVASLAPRLLNIHGDAQNAQVLATRAAWDGYDASVAEVHEPGDAVGLTPQAVVIGSGFDSDAEEVLGLLTALGDSLRAWVAEGVPLLAVGLGWELLSAGTELVQGSALPGLGLFSGRFLPAERASGPIALDSEWGRLVGYGYHYRDYELGEGERALGRVLAGVGNRTGSASCSQMQPAEGVVCGKLFGTTLRGPILGRNPKLADSLLSLAIPGYRADDAEAAGAVARATADEFSARTNGRVIAELGLH